MCQALGIIGTSDPGIRSDISVIAATVDTPSCSAAMIGVDATIAEVRAEPPGE